MKEKFRKKSNVLVVGAGVIGSSVAMHLGQKGVQNVHVVDFDLDGIFSSSELNAGGVRATWVQPLNIQISKASIEYFESVKKEVGYHACGYLWLFKEDRWKAALKARETQVKNGWKVDVWDVAQLRKERSFIDKTDDLAGAVFAPKDGLVNPNLLKIHFRDQAKKNNAEFFDRIWVDGFEVSGNQCVIYAKRVKKSVEFRKEEFKKQVLLEGKLPEGSYERVVFETDRIVNCAGAWAPELAKILKTDCPSYPLRRQIAIFDCREIDLRPYGMIVDPSGIYFHPEATNGLAGYADPNEPKGKNFEYDGDHFFMEKIWPALYERSTKFERLKHLTGWSGLYEVSPDESGIVGEAKVLDKKNESRIFEAHSFSGHGAMQSYSIGKGLAEKMSTGRYDSLDLDALSVERFEKNQLLVEKLVI